MVKKDSVKKITSNQQQIEWKNPYQAKRNKKMIKEVRARDQETTTKKQIEPALNTQSPDLIQAMNNFRDGIKGISGSIQQFEKTMESLTHLYKTIDNLGGIKRLNEFLSPISTTRGNLRSSNDTGNLFNHLKTFIGMLEKVDFNQINQFLGSPMIQGMVNEDKKD